MQGLPWLFSGHDPLLEAPCHLIQNPVDKGRRLFAAELLGNLDCLVDGDVFRDIFSDKISSYAASLMIARSIFAILEIDQLGDLALIRASSSSLVYQSSPESSSWANAFAAGLNR